MTVGRDQVLPGDVIIALDGTAISVRREATAQFYEDAQPPGGACRSSSNMYSIGIAYETLHMIKSCSSCANKDRMRSSQSLGYVYINMT